MVHFPKDNSAIYGLEPARVWEEFANLNRYPRRSKKEVVMLHFEEWAAHHGFVFKRDAVGNLCIHIPGSPGYEHLEPVCLQGHADMVCVKDPQEDHDFSSDPIILQREGDFIRAKTRTTLGADDGIGVAAAMAIATDPQAIHPPLEILITVNEEDGMTGAANLDPIALGMRSRRILNLDEEDEGSVCVSSAGMTWIDVALPYTLEANLAEGVAYDLVLTGLPGGHSGVLIHEDRGNSIREMAEFLDFLHSGEESVHASIIHINGGEARNSIPKSTVARIIVSSENDGLNKFERKRKKWEERLQEKWSEARVLVETLSPPEVGSPVLAQIMNFRLPLLSTLRTLPNGVERMSQIVPNLVETSSNIGRIETVVDEGKVKFQISVRSLKDSEMKRLKGWIIERCAGYEVAVTREMTPWDQDPDSPLVQAVVRSYEAVSGKKAHIRAVHAGLETGYLVVRLTAALGGLVEAVAFGPNVLNAHEPEERVSISSVDIFYKQLKTVLAGFCEGTVA